MRIVLLSGGSGKRLWPLSNEVRSKQFLKVVRDKNGRIESMLQRVYRQLCLAGLDEGITVATSMSQVESIKGQLGEKVSVVVEPERRNTFPAIALSAAHLFFEKNCPPDETMVVLPVDPFVEDRYFRMLQWMDSVVQAERADIVLMGVKPTYPSEKYGYIIPDSTQDRMGCNENSLIQYHGTVLKVLEFKEKPDALAAQDFIGRGGLWNCGVFAFKISYLIDILDHTIGCGCYADIEQNYNRLEKTSFDYAVVEKAESVAVVTYDGGWKDLGTWNTLTEVMEEKTIGDVSISENCKNTHVINELGIPVVVMGVKDIVVAASPDGILVSDKEQSSHIKKYIESRDLRPMFEERSWGEYTVLNISVDKYGNRTVTKKKTIQAGKEIGETKHRKHLEVWTMLSGRAVISIKGRKHDAFSGDTFTIERGVLHSLQAKEDTVLLEVQIGTGED